MVNFQARMFRGTVFQFDNTKDDPWDDILSRDHRFDHAVYQVEKCPNTGRLHIQFYIHCKAQMRAHVVQAKLGDPTCHIDKVDYPEHAKNYCRKEESRVRGPFEHGRDNNQQGKRTDLDRVVEAINNGSRLDDVAMENPNAYIKYHGGIQKYHGIKRKSEVPNWRDLKVVILWGEAGTGKTRYATSNHDSEDIFIKVKSGQNLWWCGYDMESVLILDDYAGWIPYRELLKVLDGNKISLQVKNGHTCPNWTTVYITSNKHPMFWYSDDSIKQEMWNQDKRRGTVSRRTAECWHCTYTDEGMMFKEEFTGQVKLFNNEYQQVEGPWVRGLF